MIHELSPRVIAYCHGLTRDLALAEDAAQEALAALVRRWRRYGPPRTPAAFVFTVARRRAFRALARRRLLAPLDDDLRVGGSDPHARTEQRSELERVLGALGLISRRDRSALLLVTVAELDYADAAAALGISLSALKMRIHRARRRLAAQLDGGNP